MADNFDLHVYDEAGARGRFQTFRGVEDAGGAMALGVVSVGADGEPTDAGGAYSATFAAIAATAAQDAFEIVAPADKWVQIIDVSLNQYTDFGDAAAEILSVTILRGHTTSGSGGAAVTPQPLKSGGAAATATVERNNTTVATNGSPVTLVADAWNISAGWLLPPALRGAIWLAPSERAVVRISVPADSLTINGTLTFREKAA